MVVALNKVDMVEDAELLELVELEVRRVAEQVSVSGRRAAGGARERAGGVEWGAAMGEVR